MCRVHEREPNMAESRVLIQGFAAARASKEKSANPYSKADQNNRDAWEYGWDCWHRGVLIWPLENKLLQNSGRKYIEKARAEFSEKRQLPPELERILEQVAISWWPP